MEERGFVKVDTWCRSPKCCCNSLSPQ